MKKIKFRLFLKITLILFVLLNLFAYYHAYRFTHYSLSAHTRTLAPEQIGLNEKLKLLATGIDNPRPKNRNLPDLPFKEITLTLDQLKLSAWTIHSPNNKGTVLLFHGFNGEKSGMINKARYFLNLGYNCMLIDFRGSGKSDGNETSIGYHEARDVKAFYDYAHNLEKKELILFGTSMGAVAIMKALKDYQLKPNKVILECPFSSLYQTVCARFKSMHVPTFPMAGLLTFWGGVQQGYWGFSHNPVHYANAIKVPVLLFIGKKDKRVSLYETKEIYKQLKGNKKLVVLLKSGHEDYTKSDKENWEKEINSFLASDRAN